MNRPAPLLTMRGIRKSFPGVTALDGVDLEVMPGETHVLLGENGAGKSTLVSILAGLQSADAGDMSFAGQAYAPQTPREAMAAGVRIVHQELNLLTYLSVAENILFEALPSRLGIVDRSALRQRAEQLLERVGLKVDPDRPVEGLGIAQMQLIEIARALAHDSQLLVLDEPTAPLTGHETRQLFAILQQLKADGVSLIYISHRLREAVEIGDRYTVLRNGCRVTTQAMENTPVRELVRHMVGKEMEEEFPFRESVVPGDTLLQVEDLRIRGSSAPVSFAVHRGEILGVAGLVGSGRSEHVRAIFGADRKLGGRILLDGMPVTIDSPRDAVGLGISFVTEDRKVEGLIQDSPISINATLANLPRVSRRGLLEFEAEREAAQGLFERLGIAAPSIDAIVRNLSGGNQQKTVLAKWLFCDTRLLIIDEPTRGIDVGARSEIYELLWDLAAEGMAIIMISSDLPEVMGLSHRLLVFSNGGIAGTLTRDEFDSERVLELAYSGYVAEVAA